MLTQGISQVLEVEITPANTAYHANDVVGGLIELGPLAVNASGGIVINGLALVDEDNEGAALDVHLFSAAPAAIADHAAFAPTYADLKKRVRKVAIAANDYETINSLKVVYKEDLNDLIPAGRVWVYVVATATPTYAATKKLYLRLFVMA